MYSEQSIQSQRLSNFNMIKCYHTGFCLDIPQQIFMRSHGQSIFRSFRLRRKSIFWAPGCELSTDWEDTSYHPCVPGWCQYHLLFYKTPITPPLLHVDTPAQFLPTWKQRWHNISLIYRKTRNFGTFPLIFIVLLSYRQTQLFNIVSLSYQEKNLGKLLYHYRIGQTNIFAKKRPRKPKK